MEGKLRQVSGDSGGVTVFFSPSSNSNLWGSWRLQKRKARVPYDFVVGFLGKKVELGIVLDSETDEEVIESIRTKEPTYESLTEHFR